MSMDQRDRRRQGSRRAEAARARRQEARQRRRGRRVLYTVGGAVALVVAVVAIVLLRNSGPDLGVTTATLPAQHSPPYVYNTRPPSSGNHLNAPSRYGFLGQPLVAESVVHNMEHGAAVIWYQPDDADLAGQVNGLVRDLGSECLIAGSYADMDFPVVATVWGRLLPLDSFDREQLAEFLRAYRGSAGPEAGLCRAES